MSASRTCPGCGREGTLQRPQPSVVYCKVCTWRREHGVVVRDGSTLRAEVAEAGPRP